VGRRPADYQWVLVGGTRATPARTLLRVAGSPFARPCTATTARPQAAVCVLVQGRRCSLGYSLLMTPSLSPTLHANSAQILLRAARSPSTRPCSATTARPQAVVCACPRMPMRSRVFRRLQIRAQQGGGSYDGAPRNITTTSRPSPGGRWTAATAGGST